MNYKDFNGQWPVYEKVLFTLDEGTENPVNLMIYIRNNKHKIGILYGLSRTTFC